MEKIKKIMPYLLLVITIIVLSLALCFVLIRNSVNREIYRLSDDLRRADVEAVVREIKKSASAQNNDSDIEPLLVPVVLQRSYVEPVKVGWKTVTCITYVPDLSNIYEDCLEAIIILPEAEAVDYLTAYIQNAPLIENTVDLSYHFSQLKPEIEFENSSIAEIVFGSIESVPEQSGYQWAIAPYLEADAVSNTISIRGKIYNGCFDDTCFDNNFLYSLDNGYFIVRTGNAYGLIDTNAHWMAEPEFKSIEYGYDGYALVLGDTSYNEGYTFDSEMNLYYIDDIGFVTGTDSDHFVYWDAENNCLAETGFNLGPLPGRPLYNSNGTTCVINVEAGQSANEVYIQGANYAVYSNGRIVTDFVYEDHGPLSGGLLAVKQNGRWGYVNAAGETVIPCEYDAWEEVSLPILRPANCTDGYVVLCKDGKYALYDDQGQVVIPFNEFEALCEVYNGRLWAKQDGKWGVLQLPNSETEPTVQEQEPSNPELAAYYEILSNPDGFIKYDDAAYGDYSYAENNTSLQMAIVDLGNDGTYELLVNSVDVFEGGGASGFSCVLTWDGSAHVIRIGQSGIDSIYFVDEANARIMLGRVRGKNYQSLLEMTSADTIDIIADYPVAYFGDPQRANEEASYNMAMQTMTQPKWIDVNGENLRSNLINIG